MAVVPDTTIAAAARSAGFPSSQIAMAVAVALAESGGNAAAVNTANKNGTTDYGLWQINSIHKADLSKGSWSNPTDNARMAYAVWSRAGGSWRPWYAWRDNKHLKFMARGQAAATGSSSGAPAAPGADVTPAGLVDGVGDAADAVKQLAATTGRAVNVLTDRDTWIRAGMWGLGVMLLWVAIIALLWSMGGKKVVGAVVGAVNPVSKAGKLGKGLKNGTAGS